MLNKLLREVVTIVVGKQAEEIADLLHSKKHVNEFILAKKLDITINQTRNILYKLSDQGLVSSIRKKDKRKGWYTYFWRIEILKSLEFLKSILSKKLDQFENQIKSRENKQFYVCEQCNIEFSEENALLHDFTCSECGEIFTSKDNTKVLREFKRHSDKITKELNLIDIEIEIEKEKLEKQKQKEFKKQAEEKKLIRQKAAAKRKAAKLKAEKESGGKKKVVKKKSAKKKIIKKKPVKKKSKTKKSAKKKVVKNKPIKKVARKTKSRKK